MNNKNILVIEDDQHSIMYYTELFRINSYQSVFVTTGKDAINVLKENNDFGIILLDIMLPDINGLNMINEIKQYNNKVPIIAQTAYAMKNDRMKCIQAGCDDYISKPVNAKQLMSIIDSYLKS